MLKLKWVDCENWDLFSVLSGRNMITGEQLAEESLSSAEGQTKLASLQDQMRLSCASLRLPVSPRQPWPCIAAALSSSVPAGSLARRTRFSLLAAFASRSSGATRWK